MQGQYAGQRMDSSSGGIAATMKNVLELTNEVKRTFGASAFDAVPGLAAFDVGQFESSSSLRSVPAADKFYRPQRRAGGAGGPTSAPLFDDTSVPRKSVSFAQTSANVTTTNDLFSRFPSARQPAQQQSSEFQQPRGMPSNLQSLFAQQTRLVDVNPKFAPLPMAQQNNDALEAKNSFSLPQQQPSQVFATIFSQPSASRHFHSATLTTKIPLAKTTLPEPAAPAASSSSSSSSSSSKAASVEAPKPRTMRERVHELVVRRRQQKRVPRQVTVVRNQNTLPSSSSAPRVTGKRAATESPAAASFPDDKKRKSPVAASSSSSSSSVSKPKRASKSKNAAAAAAVTAAAMAAETLKHGLDIIRTFRWRLVAPDMDKKTTQDAVATAERLWTVCCAHSRIRLENCRGRAMAVVLFALIAVGEPVLPVEFAARLFDKSSERNQFARKANSDWMEVMEALIATRVKDKNGERSQMPGIPVPKLTRKLILAFANRKPAGAANDEQRNRLADFAIRWFRAMQENGVTKHDAYVQKWFGTRRQCPKLYIREWTRDALVAIRLAVDNNRCVLPCEWQQMLDLCEVKNDDVSKKARIQSRKLAIPTAPAADNDEDDVMQQEEEELEEKAEAVEDVEEESEQMEEDETKEEENEEEQEPEEEANEDGEQEIDADASALADDAEDGAVDQEEATECANDDQDVEMDA